MAEMTGRRVVAWASVSMDGCTSGPGGPEHDQWLYEHAGHEQTSAYFEGIWRGASTALLGRKNYEGFYSVWPGMTRDPSMPARTSVSLGAWIDAVEKVVFSTTLTATEWENSRLATRPLEAEVEALKEQARAGHLRHEQRQHHPPVAAGRPRRRPPHGHRAVRGGRRPSTPARRPSSLDSGSWPRPPRSPTAPSACTTGAPDRAPAARQGTQERTLRSGAGMSTPPRARTSSGAYRYFRPDRTPMNRWSWSSTLRPRWKGICCSLRNDSSSPSRSMTSSTAAAPSARISSSSRSRSQTKKPAAASGRPVGAPDDPGPFQRATEEVLLAEIAQPGQSSVGAGWSEVSDEVPEVRCPTHRNDHHSFVPEVAAVECRGRIDREPIADALDQDDRARSGRHRTGLEVGQQAARVDAGRLAVRGPCLEPTLRRHRSTLGAAAGRCF